MPTRAILALNAGSSSIRFALFACPDAHVQQPDAAAIDRRPLHFGEVTGIGDRPHVRIDDEAPRMVAPVPVDGVRAALQPVVAWLDAQRQPVELAAVAHRVVHGGARHLAPVIVDPQVFDELCTLIPLAPLHQPHDVDAIDAMRCIYPRVPQIAVFDTTFHRTMPRHEQMLPLPHEWFDAGVRRYGLHGLSFEYLSFALAESFGARARGRVIAAHLGSGASLCAMLAGQSIATSTGFSVLDGVMMGTRRGSLDAGMVLHMLETSGMSHRELGCLLRDKAGLEGVSGRPADPRELLACEAHDERARDALALYVHRIVRETGALAALLGGLDMLVFTAGVGEHSAAVRARVCSALRWLGLELDRDANNADAHVISTPSSWVTVVVEPTNEAWIAARSAWRLLDEGATARGAAQDAALDPDQRAQAAQYRS